MYTLYIGNKNYSSWSLRPWVLMRTLSIPFEETLVPFSPDSNWDNFRDFSDSGLVPCLHDGDTVVWDSLAIAEYLAIRPTDRAIRLAMGRCWPLARRCWSVDRTRLSASFPAQRAPPPPASGSAR